MAKGFEVRNHSPRFETMITIQMLTEKPLWTDVELEAAQVALTQAYGAAFFELTERIEGRTQ